MIDRSLKSSVNERAVSYQRALVISEGNFSCNDNDSVRLDGKAKDYFA